MRDFVSESELARVPLAESCKADLPAPVDPVLERLTAGRARVANGWCTHTMCEGYGSNRRYCARGAVTTTGDWCGYDDVAKDAEQLLAEALPAEWRLYHCAVDVATYNNRNTQADVLALFDRAIAARKAA